MLCIRLVFIVFVAVRHVYNIVLLLPKGKSREIIMKKKKILTLTLNLTLNPTLTLTISLTLTLNELTGSWVGPNSTQVPIQLLDAIILVICDIKILVYDSLYSLRTCAIASVALIFVDTNANVFSSYDTTHPIVH